VSQTPLRVVIFSEQPLFLDGLESLLRREQDFVLTARCEDIDEALEKLREIRPAVALLDLDTSDPDRIALVRRVNDERLDVRIVLLLAHADDELLLEAVRLGVRGVLVKSMPSRLFPDCIRQVAAGEYWLEKRMAATALQKMVRREAAQRRLSLAGLTAREVEIAKLAAQGVQNLGIGAKLNISPATVKIHLHKIYQKLGLSGRIGLMVYARENNLA
jgi:DNA-binding NarL/FixJ family response regulator